MQPLKPSIATFGMESRPGCLRFESYLILSVLSLSVFGQGTSDTCPSTSETRKIDEYVSCHGDTIEIMYENIHSFIHRLQDKQKV